MVTPAAMTVCVKKRYASAGDARRAHKHASWRVRTYDCNRCHGVHVANAEKASNQKGT